MQFYFFFTTHYIAQWYEIHSELARFWSTWTFKQPFNLQPLFQKSVEKWFQKSGSRNLVREIWFEKSGSENSDFFSGWRKVVDQKKRWVYTINPSFFRLEKSGSANWDFFSGSRKVVDQKKKSEFAEPLFYTFLEKWLQIKWSSD